MAQYEWHEAVEGVRNPHNLASRALVNPCLFVTIYHTICRYPSLSAPLSTQVAKSAGAHY
jgi:hypothetical protein